VFETSAELSNNYSHKKGCYNPHKNNYYIPGVLSRTKQTWWSRSSKFPSKEN